MTTSAATERSDAGASLPIEALVLGVEEDRVRVRAAASGEIRARIAVPGYQPAEGDRVLIQRITDGSTYVLGVVRASRAPTIATPTGASASIEGERIALRDAAGRLLLTLDGATGELRLEAERDLRLSAPEGRVVVEASAMDLSVGHYELRAERIIERAADVFRTAEGILETRARHARTLVSRTLELFGRRTTIASEEDTRIDGKRVLLG
jgi:hypothetical protein